MKKILTLFLLILSIAGYSQPTRGALTTVDTTWKPTIKMVAVNKLDNLVYYWDLVSWSLVPTSGGIGAGWNLTGNSGTTAETNFLGTTDDVKLFFKTNNWRSGVLGAYRDLTGFTYIMHPSAMPAGSTFGSTIFGQRAAENFTFPSNTDVTIFGHRAGGKSTTIGDGVTIIGNNAGLNSSDAYRSVFIGQSSGYRNTTGKNNAALGSFSLELNNGGHNNTAVGTNSLRSNLDGSQNQGFGEDALLRNSTGIISIPITNGGSGYTTATVNISAPLEGSSTSAGYVKQATATAIISGGVIIGITITDNGAGYTSTPFAYDFGTQAALSATISGDGTGAILGTPVLQSGEYNSAVGFRAGFGASGNEATTIDQNSTFIGTLASRSSTLGAASPVSNLTVIGYNAKGYASNQVVLGNDDVTTTLLKGNVGIGTVAPNSTLHTNGSFATAYVAKTATYPITASDYTIECTANTFTVTLPTAVGCAGREYFITNSGAGTITLATTSSQTFKNVVATPTTLTLATLTGVLVQSNGANWLKVSSF